ncbi:ubiquitin-conjugating enzyme/RWD-like protein [Zopfochytrium polystomum]|nr:ubiquitin-conjugating enzyme/RWD-like protein [Zopfochytrium polystomum]
MLAGAGAVRKDRDGEARGGSSAAAPSQAGGGGGDGRSSGTVSLGRAGSAAAAAPATTANARLRRELQSLATDPPMHCSLWPDENEMTVIHADMDGPENSPYAGGVFRLQVRVPDRYPFQPPQVQFRTKIYHPNIDAMGRICSDVLKMPPKGCWKPTLNIKTVFSALHILLSEPNPDDPLEQEIAVEYKSSHSIYCQKAAAHTRKHATGKQIRRCRHRTPGRRRESVGRRLIFPTRRSSARRRAIGVGWEKEGRKLEIKTAADFEETKGTIKPSP